MELLVVQQYGSGTVMRQSCCAARQPSYSRLLISTVRPCPGRLPDELAANTRLKIVDLSGCPLRSPIDLQASARSGYPNTHSGLACVHACL